MKTALLTGLAAGTGWYFGAGPGALATVPETATLLPDNARQVLEAEGFEVVDGERNDPRVPAGQVSGTDPAGGQQARRGSAVTMFLIGDGEGVSDKRRFSSSSVRRRRLRSTMVPSIPMSMGFSQKS